MTQCNAVDRERSGRGPDCVKLVAVLFLAEREHNSVFDAQDGSTYVLKPVRKPVYWKNRQRRKPKHSTSTACSSPARTTRDELRPELIQHGARSPRVSREGRSGSVSRGVCRPMGSPSRAKSPSMVLRRVCSRTRVCGASCKCLRPEAQKQVQVDGRSWGLCWQLAEMHSATCWLSEERTSLMGGAWAVPLRSDPCDQLAEI